MAGWGKRYTGYSGSTNFTSSYGGYTSHTGGYSSSYGHSSGSSGYGSSGYGTTDGGERGGGGYTGYSGSSQVISVAKHIIAVYYIYICCLPYSPLCYRVSLGI